MSVSTKHWDRHLYWIRRTITGETVRIVLIQHKAASDAFYRVLFDNDRIWWGDFPGLLIALKAVEETMVDEGWSWE